MNLDTFFEKFDLFADAPNAVAKMRELILWLGFAVTHKSNGEEWPKFPLKQLSTKIGSGSTPDGGRESYFSEGIPLIRSMNVHFGGFRDDGLVYLNDEQAAKLSSVAVQENDVLLNITGASIGRVTIAPQRMVGARVNQHVTIIRCKESLDPIYLSKFLASPLIQNLINDIQVGATRQALTKSMIEQFEIPLPPLAEQKRIVAKVDELMALCDRLEAQQQQREIRHTALAQASLTRFADAPTPANLELLFHKSYAIEPGELRKSILTLAVQGKIVSQDPNDKSANTLLLAVANGDGGDSTLSKTDDGGEKPFGLPAGWVWAKFSQLGELGRGKSKHRPRNDPSLYNDGKYPLVQTGDVARSNGKISTHTGLYNENGLAQSKMWPKGTLCITIAANIADSGILGFDACFPDSVVGFIPSNNDLQVQYFEYFMRTAKSQLEKFAPATAQKNINLGILEEVSIPLPPAPEQKRIVVKVEQLMGLVDRLEAQLVESRAKATALLDAVVAELSAAA